MRTRQLMAWLTMATLTVPQSAIAAHAPTERVLRVTLSDTDLASARGGSVPTAKIGYTGEYGYLSVVRNVAGVGWVCGLALPGTGRILPLGENLPGLCGGTSIPVHSLTDISVDVRIGGMAAVLDQMHNPIIGVFVNGVAIPATELGNQFSSQCPASGTAFSQGANLTIYDCISVQNVAQIPTSRFHAGLNTITVRYKLIEAAFDDWGTDIDTRIISMN